MRLAYILLRNTLFRNSKQNYGTQSLMSPVVKVVNLQDDETIKLSLKIYNSPFNVQAPKVEDVNIVLRKIKRMAELQRQREQIKRSVANKYSNTEQVADETVEDCTDVCLIANNKSIDERTPNVEAWNQASILKIGDVAYEIQYNIPNVVNISLPSNILAGCILRPHCILEYASFADSAFSWYRSPYGIKSSDLNYADWVKVGDGLHYLTSNKDVDCYLKVVCTPKQKDKVGPDFTAVSKNVVEAGSGVFLFEERHAYTPIINDNNKFRCISYNTLAKMYVEKKKFPYASEKARCVYYRKQLLFREILGYNSDVICLQEVQEREFDYDFLPIFKKAGYDGFYMRKGGRRCEGLATFFRSSKFNMLFNEGVLLNEFVEERGSIFVDLLAKVSGNVKAIHKLLAQGTALQVVLLENAKHPGNKIVLANTHLYSNKNTPEVRLMQAAFCVYYLEHFIKSQCLDSVGVIFCGDFNSLPKSEVFHFLTTGSFECCPSWKNCKLNSDEDTTLRHNLNLDTACGIPGYTNYTEEFQGCLDYIFYSKNSFEVTDVVPMPNHEAVIAQVGLPSDYFPSDHLALVCTLKWKNKDL